MKYAIEGNWIRLMPTRSGTIEQCNIYNDGSIIFQKKGIDISALDLTSSFNSRYPHNLSDFSDKDLERMSAEFGCPEDELVEVRDLEKQYRAAHR